MIIGPPPLVVAAFFLLRLVRFGATADAGKGVRFGLVLRARAMAAQGNRTRAKQTSDRVQFVGIVPLVSNGGDTAKGVNIGVTP